MDIPHRLRYVGPKDEMRPVWYDEQGEAVGLKDEMRPVWYDEQGEAVGPKDKK